MLYESPGLLEELEQPVLIGGRWNIPHRHGITHKRPKGWDAISRLLFRGRHMDLFNLISAPNPTKVKTGTRPRATHEMPLLTVTANRMIDMENTTVTSRLLETPSAIEKSSLDFANKDLIPLITERYEEEEQTQDGLSHGIPPVQNRTTTEAVLEQDPEKEVAAMRPQVSKRRCKRGNDGADVNAPLKVLRKDHVALRPAQSTLQGKSLAVIGLDVGSTLITPATQETPSDAKSVSRPDPLSSSRETASEIPTENVATAEAQDMFSVESLGSGKSTSVPSMVGSPGGIYQPRLLKKAKAQIARRDQRIQVRQEEVKKLDQEIKSLKTMETEVHGVHNQARNFETLLEAETQVTGEERIKAAFKEFKKYEDNRVSSQYAEIDARLDALSIDFDEELYPRILTAIAGRRWVIGYGLLLVVMKCAESTKLRQVYANVVSAGITKGMCEGLKHGIEHGKANLDLAAIEAYNPEADTKYVVALHALKGLKYPLVDQLEKLKDAPIDLIMAFLYLEMPTVAPQGLAILLADAATQTQISEDEASLRLLKSKSLPPMYNLDWT
ncbi:hypothetical protein Tco_0885698 [Tanacetum coccineum]